EKDKSGSNAVAFDCCFHPNIMALSDSDSRFRDVLITTAIEGIEEYYRRAGQNVQVKKDFHVVKGVQYRSGDVPSMLIAIDTKKNWNDDEIVKKDNNNNNPAPIVKETAIKKGFLNTSTKSPPPPPSNSLIQEVSSNKSTTTSK